MHFTVSLVGIPESGDIIARTTTVDADRFEAAHAAALAMAPGWSAMAPRTAPSTLRLGRCGHAAPQWPIRFRDRTLPPTRAGA